MDVYKSKIQCDGIIDKLKLIVVVTGDLQNNNLNGYTWSQSASMRDSKYFLVNYFKHKSRLYQLDVIKELLQVNEKILFL